MTPISKTKFQIFIILYFFFKETNSFKNDLERYLNNILHYIFIGVPLRLSLKYFIK